jgi:hypothetical protein
MRRVDAGLIAASRGACTATRVAFSKMRVSSAKTWMSRIRRRGGVRHAVEIAGNAHHSLMRDAPFELENRSVRRERHGFEMGLLLGEGFVDDALTWAREPLVRSAKAENR